MDWNRGGRKLVRGTRQPRKQRKHRYNAPLHERQKLVGAPLSPDLRAKLKARALPVRRGDRVKVLSGKFRGLQGKVVRVDLSSLKVWVENAVIRKTGGREEFYPLHPSTLLITEAVDRKGPAPAPAPAAKPAAPAPAAAAAPSPF
jgi:large subunit ribosomal protein L24